MPKKRWNDLSPRAKKAIAITAALDGGLRVAALVDLKRRPAEQVRGSKTTWAVALVVTSSAGILPVGYFLLGRRAG